MVSWGLLHVENLSCTCRGFGWGFLVEGFPKKTFYKQTWVYTDEIEICQKQKSPLVTVFRSIPNETLREAHLLLRPPYAAKNIVEGQGHRPISDNE